MNKKTLIISFVFIGLALVLTSIFNVSPIVAAFLLLCPLIHIFMGHGDNGQNLHKH
ncbi:MAG TPA: DUF2933 domain-containing protein [Patescibacteria group bacterium]|nr:DUF2933 domain-containing protein [Patescibacteria group bacterium]